MLRLAKAAFLGVLFFGNVGLGAPKAVYTVGHIEPATLEDVDEHLAPESTRTSDLESGINLGFESRPIWIRLDSLQETTRDRYLKVDYPLLGRVEVYLPQNGLEPVGVAGSESLRSGIAVDSRVPVFRVPSGADHLYLRVQTNGSAQVPLQILDADKFLEQSIDEYFAFGAYYGILAVMLLYNISLALFARRKVYVWYSAYIGFYFLFQFCLNGFFAKIPVLQNAIGNLGISIFGSITFIFILQFFRALVRPEHTPVVKSIHILSVISFASFICAFALPYAISVQITVFNSYVASAAILAFALFYSVKGNWRAVVFSFAWSIFLLGVLILGLKNHGIIPVNPITTYAVQIGSVFELTLLSMYLGLLIRREQKSRIRAEEEKSKALADSKVNAAIARTTQMMAHDVRKPFSTLQAGLSVLSKTNTPEQFRHMAMKLRTSVEHSLSHVNGMLRDIKDVGASGEPKFQDVEIGEAIRESLEAVFASEKREDIEFRYDIELEKMISAEPQKLHRILTNLVSNAGQSMNHGGVIWFKASQGSSWTQLSVGNTGSYITEDEIANVFDAFYTKGKKTGTGLGLAIVKTLVEAHGGEIHCHSSKGWGTEFVFTLPTGQREHPGKFQDLPGSAAQTFPDYQKNVDIADRSVPEDDNSEAQFIEAAKNLNAPLSVLVVEDDKEYCDFLCSSMTSGETLADKVCVTKAFDKKGAEKVFGRSFDVAIIDVELGDGNESGFEIVRRLRQIDKDVRICVHSNLGFFDYQATTNELGGDVFLPKPMMRSHLFRLLSSALQKRSRKETG